MPTEGDGSALRWPPYREHGHARANPEARETNDTGALGADEEVLQHHTLISVT